MVASALPLAGPTITPSPELKQRLMARIEASRAPASAPAAGSRAAARRVSLPWWQRLGQMLQSGPRWQPVALLLLVILALGNVILWQRLLREPALPGRPVALTGTEVAPAARGTILISDDGRYGTLVVEGLPPLDAEQQYQLWLIDDGARDNGGVFSVNDDGYSSMTLAAPQPLDAYAAFGITIEPAGGSPGPTGAKVLGSS
jgi:anti-sigma-K factor RskA